MINTVEVSAIIYFSASLSVCCQMKGRSGVTSGTILSRITSLRACWLEWASKGITLLRIALYFLLFLVVFITYISYEKTALFLPFVEEKNTIGMAQVPPPFRKAHISAYWMPEAHIWGWLLLFMPDLRTSLSHLPGQSLYRPNAELNGPLIWPSMAIFMFWK